jgi:hypothetical protein
LGCQRHIAAVLNDLGHVAVRQGEYVAAQSLYGESLAIRRELEDKQGIAISLEGFAGLAAAQAHFRRAARLWSASNRLRHAMAAPRSPGEQQNHERSIDTARAALGEAAFAAEWEAGSALLTEQVIEYAIETPDK